MSTSGAREPRILSPISEGMRILLLGISMMIFGIAVAARPEFRNPDDTSALLHINSIIARSPIAVGAVLALIGGTRTSMGIRPLARTFIGASLIIGGVAVPVLAIRLDPSLTEGRWTVDRLIPFFVLRILGLILAATGLLRAFPGDKN